MRSDSLPGWGLCNRWTSMWWLLCFRPHKLVFSFYIQFLWTKNKKCRRTRTGILLYHVSGLFCVLGLLGSECPVLGALISRSESRRLRCPHQTSSLSTQPWPRMCLRSGWWVAGCWGQPQTLSERTRGPAGCWWSPASAAGQPVTGQTFGVQPSELFISSDECILLPFLVRKDLLFESFIAHSDMFRRSGLIRRYSWSCYFPVCASLVQAAVPPSPPWYGSEDWWRDWR